MKRWGMAAWSAVALLGGWLVWSHASYQEASYRGSKACILCHRTTHAELVKAQAESPHAFALKTAKDGEIVADFADAPFEKSQVAYVLGKGVGSQAYIDKDWQLLPGQWMVAEKEWVPHQALDAKAECVRCHVTGFDVEKMEWKEDNVTCESCHGPGSQHMLNPKDEEGILRLSSLRDEDPQRAAMVCGQCHSAGTDKSGEHPFPVGYKPGGNLWDYFVDAKPTEPGPNQQFSELVQSPAHWENGVTCLTCHEAHGATDQPHMLLKPVNELCADCHAGMTDLAAHAQDKGVQAAADATCATCHMPNGQHLFDKSIAPQG